MNLLEYYRVSAELKKNSRQTLDDLQKLQQTKIKAIVRHAYENVPYYHDLFRKLGLRPEEITCREDLTKIPVTSREDFIAAGDSISVQDKRSLHVEKTSGSCGKPVCIYHTQKEGSLAAASYDRARIENGFSYQKNRLLTIGDYPDKDKFWSFVRPKPIRLHVFDPIEKQRETLRKKFDSIHGYPSFLKCHIDEFPRLRHAFTASEILYSDVRQLINSRLGVDVIDIYGANEGGCIAFECHNHEGYHINMDLLVLEIMDKDETFDTGKGEVVLTNLGLFSTPFIRYKLNDIIDLTDTMCSCGKPFPLIKSIIGRRNDIVKLRTIRIVPQVLCTIFSRKSEDIVQYQVLQKNKERVNVKVILKDQGKEEEMRHYLAAGLDNLFNHEAKVDIDFVKEIPATERGKYRCIISDVT